MITFTLLHNKYSKQNKPTKIIDPKDTKYTTLNFGRILANLNSLEYF